MGIVPSKSEGSLHKLMTFQSDCFGVHASPPSRSQADDTAEHRLLPSKKTRPASGGEGRQADPKQDLGSTVSGKPVTGYCVAGAHAPDRLGTAWRPAAGGEAADGSNQARLVSAIERLPWLFPDPNGPGQSSTIFMNVWGNSVTCSACRNPSTDNRGTVFQCCKAIVCSRCTSRACLLPAERHRLDLTKTLSASGRVLEGVTCPACKQRESVGFPVNGNYGRIYKDS